MSTTTETTLPRRVGPSRRSKRSRGAIAAVAVLGMAFAAFGLGAQAALAAPVAVSAVSNSSVDAHPQDTGTVRINFGTDKAGLTITSTVSDPTIFGALSVVSSDVGSDGFVSLTNYAGWGNIDIASFSSPSDVLGGDPAHFSMRRDVGIWRAQTVDFTYSESVYGPRYTLVRQPEPVYPATGEEAATLTPIATSMVSPGSWQPGSDITFGFTNVTLNDTIYPYDTIVVQNFVYSSPTLLSTTPIYLMHLIDGTGFSYSVTVPGSFTRGGHVLASFDDLGRLVTLEPLGTVPSTPVATTVAANAALANTGQSDFIPAGIAAMVLFGAGATVLLVSYRRRASAHRE